LRRLTVNPTRGFSAHFISLRSHIANYITKDLDQEIKSTRDLTEVEVLSGGYEFSLREGVKLAFINVRTLNLTHLGVK